MFDINYNPTASIPIKNLNYKLYILLQKKNALLITSIATTNGEFLKKCALIVHCDPNVKYRSINGSCNNLKTHTWGAAETPFS